MKLKTLALAAMMGLGTLPLALQVQAAEVPEGPHVVTSGTASVDATPDIATIAIEVSVSAKDAADAKNRQIPASHNILIFCVRVALRKRYQCCQYSYST